VLSSLLHKSIVNLWLYGGLYLFAPREGGEHLAAETVWM
jgi:hypothetical protein